MTLILVVDDEPDVEALLRQRFRRQIRDGSLSFLFAHDGVEALEALALRPEVDLVLSDLNMPRMDGLTLLARLQETEDPPVTVVVSAYGDMANIRIAMNRGAFDFLTKPIDFADLEATVAKTVRHVGAMREARTRRAAAERAHAALARYFSPNLAAELAADRTTLHMAGRRRDVTAIFTDITGFTGLVESMEPPALAGLLNGYLAGMTEIVFEHGGTVAKVMGDGIHLLFGAPIDQPDHAARAVGCVLALDAFAETYRAVWRADGIELGETRIGLHAGSALVGDFGGGRYFDFAAYGDTINIAARLEAANKVLGTRICASVAVTERAPGFVGRRIGDLMLRGRSGPLQAYEVRAPQRQDEALEQAYAAAFELLGQHDAGALPAFAALVERDADDRLASFHLRRLFIGQSGVRIEL